MQGQTPPTASELRYLDEVAQLWCLPCAMDGWEDVPPTVHHVLDESGQRIGHLAVIPACGWHHLGKPPRTVSNIDTATARYGPSIEHDLRRFEEVYGPQRDLIKITSVAVSRALSMREHGDVFTPGEFMELVQHEARIRFNRGILISR